MTIDHRSRWVDIGGPVHYLDFGGPPDGPVVVGVHGLAGSALNWSAIAPLLTGRCRLLAPDLAGHGRTESLGRSTTVHANRLLLHRFVETVPGRPVILMGNSMGGMVSLLEAEAAPEAVAGLVLIGAAFPFVPAFPDPLVAAMFAAYATPGIGRIIMARRHAMPPERQVSALLDLCCVDPSRVPADVVSEHVELARHRAGVAGVERDLLHAARSVVATAGIIHGGSYRRGIRTVRVPVLLLHGARDRLVPVAASRAIARAHPSWPLVVLPDVGHVPQLEAPAETADLILGWLAATGRPAAEAAMR
ncbi:alpha/beta fold hydrolase [Virgisporangium ochraceum]|uniref:Hydrolase n=1 Tax=Virgisporangium ochraceum TaxID=65505 RepID=A0A8J3ZWF6_9ACTN|nr:alpha/beta hydrolase [Virgisporangium ochraceum]GIJ71279.1 hydrolase [Virgisporangium ochraceum]